MMDLQEKKQLSLRHNVIYHTKNPEKDIGTKLVRNHFSIVIRVYIYHFQGLGPILNSKNVF